MARLEQRSVSVGHLDILNPHQTTSELFYFHLAEFLIYSRGHRHSLSECISMAAVCVLLDLKNRLCPLQRLFWQLQRLAWQR